MFLRLIREPSSKGATLGSLYINGVWYCWTLEDEIRDEKIDGVTCIPSGRYKIIINESTRFKRRMPLLLDVPNYSGVRMHWGNRSSDTEGCLLVGNARSLAFIGGSRDTFEKLFHLMDQTKEEIWIQVENPVTEKT